MQTVNKFYVKININKPYSWYLAYNLYNLIYKDYSYKIIHINTYFSPFLLKNLKLKESFKSNVLFYIQELK